MVILAQAIWRFLLIPVVSGACEETTRTVGHGL